jgi:hypothetical protein
MILFSIAEFKAVLVNSSVCGDKAARMPVK